MQGSKRVEIVADDVSCTERQCYVDFVVRSGWNPFLPFSDSFLTYHINFACLFPHM